LSKQIEKKGRDLMIPIRLPRCLSTGRRRRHLRPSTMAEELCQESNRQTFLDSFPILRKDHLLKSDGILMRLIYDNIAEDLKYIGRQSDNLAETLRSSSWHLAAPHFFARFLPYRNLRLY
jgi:hypothetical protein